MALTYNLQTAVNGIVLDVIENGAVVRTHPVSNPTNVQHSYDGDSLNIFGPGFSFSCVLTGNIFQINGTPQSLTDRIALAKAAVAVFPKANNATGGGVAPDLSGYQQTSQKNQNNGYAGLNSSGLIDSGQLPSYVDDVIEVANFAALPVTGESGKIYVAIDVNKTYRWGGSAYFRVDDVDLSNYVPKTTTINNKQLTGNITLSLDDFSDGANNKIYSATEKAKLASLSTIKLPVNAKIVATGDSITAGSNINSVNNVNNTNNGYFTYANLYSNNLFFVPVNGNQGVAGETSTQIATRFGSVLALNPDVVIILAGTNDAVNDSSITLNNLNAMYNSARAQGVTVVAITILPRFGSYALSGTFEGVRQSVNTGIKALASEKLIVVDAESSMNNASLYFDGLHPNPAGCSILGNLIAQVLQPLITTAKVTDVLTQDFSLNPNLGLSGTTGSLANGATGQIATSFTLDAGNSGVTVVGSKIAGVNGTFGQQINLSGNYTGNGKTVDLKYSINDASKLSKYLPGDLIEGLIEYEIVSNDANVVGVSLLVQISGAGYNPLMANASSFYPNNILSNPLTPSVRYIGRTPPVYLAQGVPTILVINVTITLLNVSASTPINFSVKIFKFGVHKIRDTAIVPTVYAADLVSLKTRRAIADTAVSLTVNDNLIAFTSLTATRAVTPLSAISAIDRHYVIKDESGNAGTYPITFVGTINGVVNPTLINTAYGIYKFYSSGGSYFSE